MFFDKERIIPPGQHPHDPSRANIDPVGFALERLQTFLIWIDEHRSSYEKARNTDSADADNEMNCLKDAIEQAVIHLQRLTELVLTSHGIDPKKALPKGICSEPWNRTVASVEKKRSGKENVE